MASLNMSLVHTHASPICFKMKHWWKPIIWSLSACKYTDITRLLGPPGSVSSCTQVTFKTIDYVHTLTTDWTPAASCSGTRSRRRRGWYTCSWPTASGVKLRKSCYNIHRKAEGSKLGSSSGPPSLWGQVLKQGGNILHFTSSISGKSTASTGLLLAPSSREEMNPFCTSFAPHVATKLPELKSKCRI